MTTRIEQVWSGRPHRSRLAVVLLVGIMMALGTSTALAGEHDRDRSHERHDSNVPESKFYGKVEKIPAERLGTWVVNKREITVTKDTRIKEEHGSAVTGAYVEVEGTNNGTLFTAHKIDVKRPRK